MQFLGATEFKSTAKKIIQDGGWANETNSLTTPLLNYLGYASQFHKKKPNESRSDASDNQESSSSAFGLNVWAWQYQTCAELGNFLTGDEPPHPLPVISSMTTLEYATKTCRKDLKLTGAPEIERLDKYGGHNLSYSRLILVGGEADPWRPRTPLASLDTPTRLNYSSTPEQPWLLIPGATHCWDWAGVFPSQRKSGIPPESIKVVREMEKKAFKCWLKDWHRAHPHYNVYVQS